MKLIPLKNTIFRFKKGDVIRPLKSKYQKIWLDCKMPYKIIEIDSEFIRIKRSKRRRVWTKRKQLEFENSFRIRINEEILKGFIGNKEYLRTLRKVGLTTKDIS